MSQRLLTVPRALVTVIAVLSLATSAGAQPSAAEGATPRTLGRSGPAGHLEQLLERPRSQADKPFWTPEEAAALEQQAADGVNRQNAPSVVRTEPLPVGGNVGAYNSFWTDQNTSVVGTMRTSLILDPPDGRLPPLTPEALARITSPESRHLADVNDGRVPATDPSRGLSERCLWYRIPSIPTGYNNNYHFLQTPDYGDTSEHIHDLRVIFLDGRPHLPPHMRQFASAALGRHAGRETTNLRQPFIRRWNRPEHSLSRGWLSEAVRVTERFTRTGPDTLDYQFTVDDPETWTRSWSGALPYARTDGPMFEFACHEGNYGLLNIMAGPAGGRGRLAAGAGAVDGNRR